jgi:hypothetical protein
MEAIMFQEKILTMIKAVRLRYAILIVLLLVAVYWFGIHPWMTNWGSTVAERQMALFGDELTPEGAGQSTKAITINAPADIVWQWLVQIGQNRAGYYTYTWLENLVGADIHNVNEIRPEWQTLNVGDVWGVVPPDYLGGLGKDAGFRVRMIESGHAIVLETMGAFVLMPVDENTTRLLVRGEAAPANVMMRMVVEPVVFTMVRPMLLGLKARAEGRPDAPILLTAIAYLGWLAAGITVAYLFLSQRRRRYWLALPVIAALPALLMAGDVQAALAAFLAAGIPVLGFLIFGRSFWGTFLIIASVVLLTLLLAPEAYIAFGLAFAVLLLAALVVTVTERSKTVDEAAHHVATPAQ